MLGNSSEQKNKYWPYGVYMVAVSPFGLLEQINRLHSLQISVL